ncbi:MAG: thioredoxin [Armatimonadota bacterium]|nr:thioredoxin [Armatimonadota bacterium]MDR7401042.1 thioredoxin [Armatimonadota bacterium]MDR7403250.1 thioredoxin [Armatimonadota bacterium]MDR7436337.1 thioredoxin [Armatimonadota bacterium]MDR7471175.1 thioredoxin [Armatimonadota bacterium]
MGNVVHVSERDFDAQVLRSDLPVVVDFWAEWCAPCRMIAPIVEDLASEYAGRVKVVKVDVDSNPHLAHRYGIMSIPTLGVFKGGEMVDRVVGYMPKAELKKRLEKVLGAAVG